MVNQILGWPIWCEQDILFLRFARLHEWSSSKNRDPLPLRGPKATGGEADQRRHRREAGNPIACFLLRAANGGKLWCFFCVDTWASNQFLTHGVSKRFCFWGLPDFTNGVSVRTLQWPKLGNAYRRRVWWYLALRTACINTQLSADSEKLSWIPTKEDICAMGYWAMLNSLQIRMHKRIIYHIC
jgi:hypothetical protein